MVEDGRNGERRATSARDRGQDWRQDLGQDRDDGRKEERFGNGFDEIVSGVGSGARPKGA